eukprot:scaffold1867_cov247-Pinguiococcus_pyrenoidosus.AAC.3
MMWRSSVSSVSSLSSVSSHLFIISAGLVFVSVAACTNGDFGANSFSAALSGCSRRAEEGAERQMNNKL